MGFPRGKVKHKEKDNLLQNGNLFMNTSVFYIEIYPTAIHKHTQIFFTLIILGGMTRRKHTFSSQGLKNSDDGTKAKVIARRKKYCKIIELSLCKLKWGLEAAIAVT